MIRFLVTVRTADQRTHAYHAIARHWCDLFDAAIDQHGICRVTVRPA